MGPENRREESGFAIASRYLETVWTAISSVRITTGRPPSFLCNTNNPSINFRPERRLTIVLRLERDHIWPGTAVPYRRIIESEIIIQLDQENQRVEECLFALMLTGTGRTFAAPQISEIHPN